MAVDPNAKSEVWKPDSEIEKELSKIQTIIHENVAKKPLQIEESHQTGDYCSYSIFQSTAKEAITNLVESFVANSETANRCIGSIVGMGLGDSVGAPLEFVTVEYVLRQKHRPRFILKKMATDPNPWKYEYNRFRLCKGQWTDDAAMGLCLADSLIIKQSFDGSDIRIRFWNWWYRGYNNAFRLDDDRRRSVGLGGNISQSIELNARQKPTPIYEVNRFSEDSGNGSLMRLSPIPIFYHSGDMNDARHYAFQSSLTTHPGFNAGECCSFMTFVIISAIRRVSTNPPISAQHWLDMIVKTYANDCLKPEIALLQKQLQSTQNKFDTMAADIDKSKEKQLASIQFADKFANEWSTIVDATDDFKSQSNESNDDIYVRHRLRSQRLNAKRLIIQLIESNCDEQSGEYCWNWKRSPLDYKKALVQTLTNRGERYNGYPVYPHYFGSYCMDGLAMALHSFYYSTDFGTAIEGCVNLLGDADTTGSICGQIAGAFYGYQSIANGEYTKVMLEHMNRWDNKEFQLRGILLYRSGLTVHKQA